MLSHREMRPSAIRLVRTLQSSRRQAMSGPFKVETQESEPICSGDAEIVVRSRAAQIALPFGRGGFIWNRPLEVRVRRPGFYDQTLPVRDVTRLAQLAIVACGLAVSVVVGGL